MNFAGLYNVVLSCPRCNSTYCFFRSPQIPNFWQGLGLMSLFGDFELHITKPNICWKLYPLFSWVMWNRTGHLPRPVYTGFAEHRVTSKNWCWNHIKNFLPYLETMFHTWEEITPCLMVTKHTWPFDGEPSWKAVGPSSSMIREMVSPGSPTRDKNTWY